MKEHFLHKRFSKESMKLIDHANSILDDYAGQGYRVSLRQLYYRFVAQNLIENSSSSYQSLGRLISEARLAGYVDWDTIEDRGRRVVAPTYWDGPADILEGSARAFKLNKWENQKKHVEVMVEKQAMEGIFIPVCQEYDVPFHMNKGYSSSSAMYEIGKRLQERSQLAHKDIIIIYAGDHDPSGVAMTDDVLERLQMFSQCDITVLRIALNMKQIERYNPPPQASKETDSRTPAYIERFGTDKCYELDALEPSVLAGVLRASIKAQVDEVQWKKDLARERDIKDDLQSIADQYRSDHSAM